MGGYANIKPKKFYQLLKWLANNKNVEVSIGGKHNVKVKCRHTSEVYPLPLSHRKINKHIVKDFVRWLEENKICSKEEFDSRI